MKTSTLRVALLVLAIAFTPLLSPAQPTPAPPGQISYQGFLTDANGIPLATNAPRNYTIVFRIWDASTSGNLLWAEQQIVTVDRGYFTVMLGVGSGYPGAPFTNNLSGLFSGSSASDRYIGITATDLSASEIAPRLRLLASPYSFLASTALSVDASGLAGLAPASGSTNYVQNQTNVDQAAGLRINGNALFNGGRVGIGTTSPSRALEVHGSGDTEIGIQSTDPSSHLWTLQSSAVTNGSPLYASFQIIDRTAGASRFFISPLGKVGIGTSTPATQLSVGGNADFAGSVGIGTSSFSDTLQVNGMIQGIGFRCRAGNNNAPDYNHTFNFDWDPAANHVNAYIDGVYVGAVSGTSDRRLKEDIQPLANDALERLMELKPSTFKYKEVPGSIFHGDGRVNEGFIADELQQVIPSAVNGEKDALTKDGQIQPQTLNIIPVVSVLTKAMQEEERAIQGLNQKLEQRLEQKETELTELKARLEKLEALLEHNSIGAAH